MKKVLKIIALLVGLLVLSILVACNRESQSILSGVEEIAYSDEIIIYTSGDYLIYRDIDELVSDATDIIRVEILDSRVEMILTLLPPFLPGIDLSDEYEICTVHRIRVIDVFKGSQEPGAIMEVMQLGGSLGRYTLVNDSFIDFAIGDELILFMYTFDDELPDVLLTPHQAVYRVVSSADGSIEIENFCQFNLLTLTISDLEHIADVYFDRLRHLTFNLNGGIAQANFPPQTVREGHTARRPATNPTRSNFIFDGWFTHPYEGDDNNTAFDFATPITENTTIYARWTPVLPRIHHIDRGASVIRGSGISGATVRVYLPCTSIVYAVAPVCANGNWTVDISAAGHQPLRGGSVVYASQTVDGRISDRSHRDVSNYAAPTVGLRFFYEWRVSAVGRPGNVMAGHGVTLTIFLENADVIDAHDIVLRICAFDWLPYHQMIRIGGSIDMYHCVASGQLIFNVGTLLSGDYAIFTVTAQATRSVDRGAIADRDITFTARYGNSTPPVEFMELYEWRVDATGRPGNVVAGGSVTFIIFLQNTDIIDAHDVVMRICAFDWLPYYRMFQIGGSIDMYHCVASGQLIFNLGTLQSGDFAMFTLTAPATKSVSRDMIADRQITVTANAA